MNQPRVGGVFPFRFLPGETVPLWARSEKEKRIEGEKDRRRKGSKGMRLGVTRAASGTHLQVLNAIIMTND